MLVTGLAGGLGIFTNTTLQRAILDGRPLDQLAVGDASSPVVTVRASDTLGDAMALLLRARVHRLVVLGGTTRYGHRGAGPVQLPVQPFAPDHAVQIEQAQDLERWPRPPAQTTRLIAALHRSGTRIGLMAELVQQLNARLFERARAWWPRPIWSPTAAFCDGQRGRGEQLLKTDQDNGLVLRDGYAPPPTLMPSASASPPFWSALATPDAQAASCSATRPGAVQPAAFTQRTPVAAAARQATA